MESAFERLRLPRQLSIDEALLDDRVRLGSREAHPDFGGEQVAFEQVREDGEQLKSPLSRLRLAIELEGGQIDSRGRVEEEIMDLFSPVADLVQQVEEMMTLRSKAKSALGRATLEAKIPGLKKEAELLMEKVLGLEAGLAKRFERFDRHGWRDSLDEMELTCRGFAFLARWREQLQRATGRLLEALLGA